ncbi:MAG: hypothetical protein R3E77_06640 [Steroidobacteraceae bacterium]
MRTLTVVLALACLQACGGTLGGTKSFTLDVAMPEQGQLRHRVELKTIEAMKGGSEVDSVGTFHLGRLDDGEIADVRKSLASTLQRVNWPSADTGTLDLHVLYTSYYVAHSNNDGAIVATIDWALARNSNEVTFSERFFTSVQADDVPGLNTLGKIKDLLNQHVVQRIADTSVLIAMDPGAKPRVAVPHTYGTIAEAVAPLPKRLTSLMGLPQFSTKTMDWEKGSRNEPVDWSKRLATSP